MNEKQLHINNLILALKMEIIDWAEFFRLYKRLQ